MKYDQIAGLLNGIAERFDWEKIMEGDNIIGLQQVNCIPACEQRGNNNLASMDLM